MNKSLVVPRLAVIAVLLGVTGSSPLQARTTTAGAGNISVFGSGLDNPRGLKFGPDHFLYVAEGGRGGTTSTVGQCPQVPGPVGPYTGGNTARISKFSPRGERTVIADGLPSSQAQAAIGGDTSGVAAVEFVGHHLYALLAGAGCSHGHADAPNTVLEVNIDGATEPIANLSAFLMANPVAHPEPDDFEPDGTPYSMVQSGGALYVVQPNQGELDKVALNGTVTRVVDISASQGHIVPTAVTLGPDGNFYVGTLTTIPYADGSARILKITPDGHLNVYKTGLTTITGLCFDGQGRLYVLETSTGNTGQPPFLFPNTGTIIRLNGTMSETVASGLNFPTAMILGPDGNLYVSNNGYHAPPGAGQVLKVIVNQRRYLPITIRPT